MSQPARKPDPAASKRAESLPVDDPSIPVLTERLTLPPLDLDLDFRLPERPAAAEQTPATPVDDTRLDDTPVDESVADESVADAPVPEEHVADAPVEPPAPDIAGAQEAGAAAPEAPPPQDESDATLPGLTAPVEPPESDDMPRVPTSLLISNVEALLPTPAENTLYHEADEFEITRTGGARPDRMEADLREMILLEIARRLPTEVETIVRRHLEKSIEDAIRRFAAEVRIALAGSLREIVDRAVRAELERINAPRNRDN